MVNLTIDLSHIYNFVSKDTVFVHKNEVIRNIDALYNKTGRGNDFLGWVNLPTGISATDIKEINTVAKKLKKLSDVVVVIGIGGSYLGAKAVIEALGHSFSPLLKKHRDPHVIFAGQNICEDYHHELLEILDEHDYSIIVISKSGTTTEPAIAFRLLKKHLVEKYGKTKAKERIVAITDAQKGALKQVADDEGYKTFVIPDDVGGRYSVLTPVGLLPIAVAGYDVGSFVEGARTMMELTNATVPFEENPAALYATARNALYKGGRNLEMLVNYNPKLHFIAEWWKQLYGESEGKENKGIFPASVDFTSDLHSMGQYIQDGERHLFETVISVKEPYYSLCVPHDQENLDKLNFIADKRLSEINTMARIGTMLAHIDGGVPNMQIEIPKLDEYYLGQLLYFFEIACGISGYLLDVNPFDQPGVEAYKNNMFALLGKPGYEEATKKIMQRLND